MEEFDFNKIKSFPYFTSHALKIRDRKTKQIVPFRFNPIQAKLNILVETLLATKNKAKVIILKARREGLSTYVEGRIFHEVVTIPNTSAFIVAHDKDGLNTIFNMSKLFYEELPSDIRPMIRYSSKKELVFENPSDRLRLTEPGLRSSIEVFSANKVTASRSGGYHAAHFSEVAFYDYAEDLLTATVSSLENANLIFLESTANGRGDYFHNEWTNAKRGESVYTPIFFSWLEFPDYQIPFHSPKERKEFGKLDDEEKMLMKKYGASLEQLNFRRDKILNFQGDLDKFHQEYPVDDVEAFVASGTSYFKRSKLRDLLNKTSSPTFIGEIDTQGLHELDDGELLIWEHPLPTEQYVIGIDPSAGIEGGDLAAIEILKASKSGAIVEQVGEWAGVIDPVLLGKLAILLGEYYNYALLVPEINNHGLTTLNEIKEAYYNVYQWQYFDRFTKVYSQKLGWETNMSTRPMLCDYTYACINADVLIIRSGELINEMMGFIHRDTERGGGEATYGSYDDRLFAYMIALYALAHSVQASASLLSNLGSFRGKGPDSTNVIELDSYKVTHTSRAAIDTDNLPQSLQSTFTHGNGNLGWLNY